MPIAIPRNSHSGNTAAGLGPSANGTRGLKGLFSRNKAISPEPTDTTRSRFRTLVDDVSGRTLGRPTQKESHTKGNAERSVSRSGGEDPHQTRRPTVRQRPQSPQETARRGRVGIALPPSIQKGNDGKWQQPSLSKGSMSTSALTQLRDDDNEDGTARPAEPRRGKPGLHALFSSGRVDKDLVASLEKRSPAGRTIRLPDETRLSGTSHGMQPGPKDVPAPSVVVKSRDTIRPIPKTPTRPAAPLTSFTRVEGSRSGPSTRPGSRHTTRVEVSSRPSSPPTSHIRASHPVSSAPISSGHGKTSTPTQTHVSGGIAPPPTMATSAGTNPNGRHASESTPAEFLSLDHYHIRLATSFLLKTLTLIVKGAAFTASEKNIEMKKLAEERLAQLGRLERHWGAEWIRAAAAGFEQKEGDGLVRQDEKVHMANIGERAKERERRGFVDALRDGVLLCLYLNFLFPAQPSHITRVNMSDDGVHKTTNIPRFIQACATVNLPMDVTLGIQDILDGTETSTGRLASTVVSLARIAGRRAATRSKSPTPTRSPITSRPSSCGPAMTPPGSPPQRTRSVTTPTPPISPTRPTLVPRPVAPTRSSPPQSRMMERNRSADSANDLQTKLQAVVEMPPPSPGKQAFPTTPTTSGFSVSSADTSPGSKVALLPRQSLNRSQTQPNVSPTLRPRSTTSTSTSGSTTPTHSRRPSLRPRNTTSGAGTGTRVSFADKEANSTTTDTTSRSSISSLGGKVGLHVKERTPSLISGTTSRTTSAHTRSSVAYSALTVLGDIADGVTVVDDLDDDVSPTGSPNMRDRSRRNSEKTLHNARQKFIGSLITPNDLVGIVRSPNNEVIGEEEVLRAEAFSKSLAALEGGASVVRSGPNRSISSKQMPITEHVVSDFHQTLGEEGDSFHPDLSRAGPRHGFKDRYYPPSRSTSPTQFGSSPEPSPTLGGFNFGPPPLPSTRPISRTSSRTSAELVRPGLKVDRRVSDRNVVYRNNQGMSLTDVSGGQSDFGRSDSRSRMNSMLTSSSSGRHSGDRNGRSRPVSLLMLEFENDGGEIVRYQLGGSIGRGQFGVVYKALNMSTGQMVAVKRISLEGMDDKQVKEVMREVELLKTLSHPSIVKYEGMKRDDDTLDIILEYAENGSLGSLIKDFGSLSETLVASYTAKILEGLDYLHGQGVIHRDLKAANILSTKNGNVKLSDFGVSLNTKAVENIKQEILTASKNGGKANLSDVVGTPNWMAPEIIDMTGASFASDIWSLGCTIVELLTGLPPYASVKNSLSVMYRIVEDNVPPIPFGLPEDLDHFLTLCFQKEPRARPSARQLFSHPWLLKNCPELSMLRGQDSIPFLRRVGTGMPSVTAGQVFPEGRPTLRSRPVSFAVSTLPTYPDHDFARKRLSFSESTKPSRESLVKVHQLVKTTFAKAIICRVCDTRAKAGVFCQDCGLICHAGCVTKEVNRCDPLEQLALYTRQRELSTSATAGAEDSTVSLGHYPLKLDSTITALPAHIWKRSRAALERRGSNMLAPPGRHSANRSVDELKPVGVGRSASIISGANSSGSDKENERPIGIEDRSSDDQDTVRQAASTLHPRAAVVDAYSETAVNGHAKGKESKSDCSIM